MSETYEGAAEKLVRGEPLTHDEQLRGTALALAAKYYVETIVKDGDLYREMMRENKVLKPATYCGVIEVAIAFEAFLRGEIQRDDPTEVAQPPKEEGGNG